MGDLVGVRRLERSARRALTRLHEQVGEAGLMAAALVPGLIAVIDQHAAAIRDILAVGVESGASVAGEVLLAGYAQGVQDHLRERGEPLRVPTDVTTWPDADWFAMRLVAVCALARDLRPGHPVGAGDEMPSLA